MEVRQFPGALLGVEIGQVGVGQRQQFRVARQGEDAVGKVAGRGQPAHPAHENPLLIEQTRDKFAVLRRTVERRGCIFEEPGAVAHETELGDELTELGCGLFDQRRRARVHGMLPRAADILELDPERGRPLRSLCGGQGGQIVLAVVPGERGRFGGGEFVGGQFLDQRMQVVASRGDALHQRMANQRRQFAQPGRRNGGGRCAVKPAPKDRQPGQNLLLGRAEQPP